MTQRMGSEKGVADVRVLAALQNEIRTRQAQEKVTAKRVQRVVEKRAVEIIKDKHQRVWNSSLKQAREELERDAGVHSEEPVKAQPEKEPEGAPAVPPASVPPAATSGQKPAPSEEERSDDERGQYRSALPVLGAHAAAR